VIEVVIEEDTMVDIIKCITTMELQCTQNHLIKTVQDKEETEDIIVEVEAMTSVSNQEKREEDQLDNSTIIKELIIDRIPTITMNKITNTMIDNNTATLVNNNSCTTTEAEAQLEDKNHTTVKIETIIETNHINSEVVMTKE
jgi:hypothetical protein|tara:strand:+ start:240 stop:665 length:426 start_codon:yes stop_codon:yes gene_type:complete